MTYGRTLAMSLALMFAAGCAGGGPATSPATAPLQPQSSAPYPAESSAARWILANVGRDGAASRSAQSWDDDDGGWSELQLPVVKPCANGTYATDCAAWQFGAGAPALNFCRDAALYPSDVGPSALPVSPLGPSSFALSYTGRLSPPVVAFATRWWTVRLQGGISGPSRAASALTVTPLSPSDVTRGWLVFFTWSWPADVLLVPFAINEIQVPQNAAPLAVPPNGSATLRAFDCVGRKIAARKLSGSIGFSADSSLASVTSAGSELVAPVFGGAAPAGSIGLSDDRGARALVPVAAATSSPGR